MNMNMNMKRSAGTKRAAVARCARAGNEQATLLQLYCPLVARRQRPMAVSMAGRGQALRQGHGCARSARVMLTKRATVRLINAPGQGLYRILSVQMCLLCLSQDSNDRQFKSCFILDSFVSFVQTVL